MSKTKIEWAEHSWNPLRCLWIDGKPNQATGLKSGTGCTMVSPGCLNCYASAMNYRFYGNKYSFNSRPDDFFIDEEILSQPMKIKKPTRFFVCSMTDLFHGKVSFAMIGRIFSVMHHCPQHTFMVLTKRPKRMYDALVISQELARTMQQALPLPNVWLGVTAENQEMLEQRVPYLLQIPAAVRFVSIEPMLGPIEFFDSRRWSYLEELIDIGNYHRPALDWVICGGESGHGARPVHPDWIRTIRDECLEAEVPFFFKQWGEFAPVAPIYCDDDRFADRIAEANEDRCIVLDLSGKEWPEWQPPDGSWMIERVGKKAAGRLLDGREWNEMPEVNR